MPETDQLDRTFRALADPTRRAMLERLAVRRMTVRELADPLPMTLSAVVQHLQALEASGLITTVKVGRTRTCELHENGLRVAETWLGDRRTTWEQRLDRLEAVLDEEAAR